MGRDARIGHNDSGKFRLNGELGNLLCFSSSVDPGLFEKDSHELLECARRTQRWRRAVRRQFPPSLFRESSWDILVDCYVARLEGHSLCVKQLHAESSESSTAFLRRLGELERMDLLSRTRDDADGRRTIVRLTPRAVGLLRTFFEQYGLSIE